MTTTPKIRVASLDFEDIKQSFIDYLKTTPEFTDYNFEASNLATLLNVLAYNAHYHSLMANFLANEVYLDTAAARSSIVSRAKELGYIPQSRRSAKATISLRVTNVTGDPASLVLPQNSLFTTTVNNETYQFVTLSSYVTPASYENGAWVYNFTAVDIYEGVFVSETSTYNQNDPTITLSNVDIDTTTLRVFVTSNATTVEYRKDLNFLTLDANSEVYFLQEGFNQLYEIYFGDGLVGQQPSPNSTIVLNYLVTSGNVANNATVFNMSSSFPSLSATVAVSTVNSAAGGADRESSASIKINALNQYGTQNRAVTATDYKAFILQSGLNVKSVNVWGGEDNNPPRYGMVMVCAQPQQGDYITETQKQNIKTIIKNKSVANIRLEFVDPDYLDVKITSTVYYNPSLLSIGTYDLTVQVADTILGYANTNLNVFGGILRHSNLVSDIDNTNVAIVSNKTTIQLVKPLVPNLFRTSTFQFSFGNELNNTNKTASISSSPFYVNDNPNPVIIEDNGAGKLVAYYTINNSKIVYNSNVGTVNYLTGDVIINPIIITGYEGEQFTIYAVPATTDIYSTKNTIVRLISSNIQISVLPDKAQ